RTACWDCGHDAVNATNDTCARCHESLTPPVLVIGFPDGRVVLRTRRASAHLGRAGAYGHIFGRYPNVSRQHAAVIVDADGDAWIEPVPAAPNGTFVNGHEILTRTRLAPEDEIRFAAEGGAHPGPVSTLIRQPQREPRTPRTTP